MLIEFLNNKQRVCISVKAPPSKFTKFVSIGQHNKKWFFCASIHPFSMNKFSGLLQLRPLPELIPYLLSSAANYSYSYTLDDFNDPAFSLVYVKTAFNALAFFMGQSFILQSVFDPVRRGILNAENLNHVLVDSLMPKWLINWVSTNVPEKAHFVVVHGNKVKLTYM